MEDPFQPGLCNGGPYPSQVSVMEGAIPAQLGICNGGAHPCQGSMMEEPIPARDLWWRSPSLPGICDGGAHPCQGSVMEEPIPARDLWWRSPSLPGIYDGGAHPCQGSMMEEPIPARFLHSIPLVRNHLICLSSPCCFLISFSCRWPQQQCTILLLMYMIRVFPLLGIQTVFNHNSSAVIWPQNSRSSMHMTMAMHSRQLHI